MNSVFTNLSARERRLAVVTLLILVGAAFVLLGLRAYNHVASLDGKIAQLEQELLKLTQRNAQRTAVEAAYREVVTTHSSEMTKEEIHDNLRREIFSMAKISMPDKEGEPHLVDLVKIPGLREGSLKERREGYREYQVRFTIPPTTLLQLAIFLHRIETSSQILRIEGLDLGRSPESTQIHAALVVTRTVLDSPDTMPQSGGTGSDVIGAGSV